MMPKKPKSNLPVPAFPVEHRKVLEKPTLMEEIVLHDNLYAAVLQLNIKPILIDALMVHPSEDSKWQAFGKALLDPDNQNIRFARLAARYKIPWRELITYFLDYQRGLGMLKAASRAPDVLEHTINDALPSMDVCPKCDGEKTVLKEGIPSMCTRCKGNGEVKVKADKDARKLSLEALGYIKTNTTVNIQQNFGTNFDENMRNVSDILAEDK